MIKYIICYECDGSGYYSSVICPICKGKGELKFIISDKDEKKDKDSKTKD
jgi:DnaJ-class molecular chaperone